MAARNQVASAWGSSGSVRSPAQATCVGSDQHGRGRNDRRDRELPHAIVLGVDEADSIRPRGDVYAAGFTEVESTSRASCSRVNRRVGPSAVQVEVGHAPPEQRVSVSEVVVDVQTGEQ